MDFPGDISSTEEYKILKSHLDENLSLDETVQKFTAATKDQQSAEDKLLRAWDALTYHAARTPADSPTQETLVTFLLALQKSTQEIGELDGEKATWSGLPLYGRQVREHWNYDEDLAQKDENVASNWANANAFQARVTARASKFSGTDPLDFSLYAIWALRKALEDKDDVPFATVHTAAQWILYAGDVLRRLSKEKRGFEGEVAKPGDKYPGKGWRGFEMDRWRSWENRFANVAEVAGDEGVRGVAKSVKRKMQDLANC